MSMMDRVTDRLLRVAESRWPEDLRTELGAEWRAEVSWLRNTGGTGWRRLRFAASLAATRPTGVGVHHGVGRSGPVFGALATVLVAGVVAFVLSRVLVASAFNTGQSGVAQVGLNLSLFAALVTPMLWWGLLAGRRSRLSESPNRRRTDLTIAGLIVTGLIAGMYLVDWNGPPTVQLWKPATMLMVPVVYLAMRLASTAGSRRSRWTVAGGCWATAAAMMVLFVLAFQSGPRFPVGGVSIDLTDAQGAIAAIVVVLTGGIVNLKAELGSVIVQAPAALTMQWAAMAFAVSYGWGLRRHVTTVATEQVRPTPARTRHHAAGVLAGLAVATWAAVLAFATPLAEQLTAPAGIVDTVLLSAHELRWAAIVLAATSMAAFLAGRAPVLWPCLLVAGLLAILDAVAERAGWSGLGWFLLLAGAGGAAVTAIAVAALRRRCELLDRDVVRSRVVVGVWASVCSAALAIGWRAVTSVGSAWELPAVSVTLAVALAVIAVISMSGPAIPAVRWPTDPRLVLGALWGIGWAATFLSPGLPVMELLLGPITVAAIAATGWRPRGHARLRRVLIVAVAVAGSAVVLVSSDTVPELVGPVFANLSGVELRSVGLGDYISGGFAFVMLAGLLAAGMAAERAAPACYALAVGTGRLERSSTA